MKAVYISASLVGVSAILLTMVASAQTTQQCPFPPPDVGRISTNWEYRLSLVDSVRQDNFSEMSASFDLSALLDGIPVGAGFDAFNSARSSWRRRLNIRESENFQSDVWKQAISPEGYQAYVECLRNSSDKQLRVVTESVTPGSVTFRVLKRDGNTGEVAAELQVVTRGGSPRIQKIPMTGNGETTVDVSRRPRQDLTVQFRLVGASAGGPRQLAAEVISLPPYISFTRTPRQVGTGSSSVSSQCGGNGNGSTTTSSVRQIVAPSHDTYLDINRIQFSTTQGGQCGFQPSATTIIDETTPERVAWRVQCVPRDWNCFGSAESTATVPVMKDRIRRRYQ